MISIKQVLNFLFLPVYLVSLIIPKKRNLCIFGAWFGKSYADNSRHLFEYMLREHPEFSPTWVTSSTEVFDQLRAKGLPVCQMYSLRGFLLCARAQYAFLSTGMIDINRFVSGSTIKIQLWHGTPLKYIQDSYFKKKPLFKRILRKSLMPYDCQKYEFVTAASEEVARIFTACFSNANGTRITGYPRTDILKSYHPRRQIVYLPTHRGEGNRKIVEVFKTFDIDSMEAFLEKVDYQLVVKLHFYDLKTLNYEDREHITFLKENIDIYRLLSETDILITDYSSVYFDFLLTGRPIVFTPFDYDEYITSDREMYYRYDEVTPGPKCGRWWEVIDELEKLLVQKTDGYIDARKKVCRMFNTYNDFSSCRRVLDEVKRHSETVLHNSNPSVKLYE